MLVSLAGSRAIDEATEQRLESLRPILGDISVDDSIDDLVEKTFKLHHEIAFISGNVLLPLLFVSFKELVCKLWHRFITNYGKELLIQNNREMISCIVARDKDGATERITSTSMESISGSKKIY